mmetsp:Transcript_51964/g.97211  ORF Transcript_51964/g.97211 Transcript_51964/m.97211 type:complete len:186 (+) Transcript_51964:53-610(+)
MNGLGAVAVLLTLILRAAASNWQDCAGDWAGCCKLDAKYGDVPPLVKFTNVTELNSQGQAGVVHISDPFFTIELQGQSLATQSISNITVQVRGYWQVWTGGPWLRYVNVRRDLCSDPDLVVKEGFCPLAPGTVVDKKVKHGQLSKFTPGGLYKSLETWWIGDKPIACVDTGEWHLIHDNMIGLVV